MLVEIGPRFVLNPVRIFSGSFGGPTLWQNPNYVSPNLARSQLKTRKSAKYVRDRHNTTQHSQHHTARTEPRQQRDSTATASRQDRRASHH
jgi:ribosome biogenesis protein BRX1